MVVIIWSYVNRCHNGKLYSFVDSVRYAITSTHKQLMLMITLLQLTVECELLPTTLYVSYNFQFLHISKIIFNLQLLNLSISDLLMASLNCVFNFIFMIDSGKIGKNYFHQQTINEIILADWPFGAVYCTINNFIANVSVAASVFTLVAISFDR